MKQVSILLLLVALAAYHVAIASGQQINSFLGPSGSYMSDPDAWSMGHVPRATESIRFLSADTVAVLDVDLRVAALRGVMRIRCDPSGVTLGHTITTSSLTTVDVTLEGPSGCSLKVISASNFASVEGVIKGPTTGGPTWKVKIGDENGTGTSTLQHSLKLLRIDAEIRGAIGNGKIYVGDSTGGAKVVSYGSTIKQGDTKLEWELGHVDSILQTENPSTGSATSGELNKVILSLGSLIINAANTHVSQLVYPSTTLGTEARVKVGVATAGSVLAPRLSVDTISSMKEIKIDADAPEAQLLINGLTQESTKRETIQVDIVSKALSLVLTGAVKGAYNVDIRGDSVRVSTSPNGLMVEDIPLTYGLLTLTDSTADGIITIDGPLTFTGHASGTFQSANRLATSHNITFALADEDALSLSFIAPIVDIRAHPSSPNSTFITTNSCGKIVIAGSAQSTTPIGSAEIDGITFAVNGVCQRPDEQDYRITFSHSTTGLGRSLPVNIPTSLNIPFNTTLYAFPQTRLIHTLTLGGNLYTGALTSESSDPTTTTISIMNLQPTAQIGLGMFPVPPEGTPIRAVGLAGDAIAAPEGFTFFVQSPTSLKYKDVVVGNNMNFKLKTPTGPSSFAHTLKIDIADIKVAPQSTSPSTLVFEADPLPPTPPSSLPPWTVDLNANTIRPNLVLNTTSLFMAYPSTYYAPIISDSPFVHSALAQVTFLRNVTLKSSLPDSNRFEGILALGTESFILVDGDATYISPTARIGGQGGVVCNNSPIPINSYDVVSLFNRTCRPLPPEPISGCYYAQSSIIYNASAPAQLYLLPSSSLSIPPFQMHPPINCSNSSVPPVFLISKESTSLDDADLPSGLIWDNKTGILSGVPVNYFPSTTFLVTPLVNKLPGHPFFFSLQLTRSCPAGSYCTDLASPPTACPAGSVCPADSTAPTPCHLSSYCPSSSSVESPCPEKNVCRSPATIEPCPAGYYCGKGTVEPDVCDKPGDYCPGSTGVDHDCQPGYYCTNSTMTAVCPAGSHCSRRSVSPLPCTNTNETHYYCPEGTAEPSLCPAHYMCPTPASLIKCNTTGTVCPESSDHETVCERGSFANTTIEVCEECALGHYASKNASAFCLLCEIGKYADIKGSYECDPCPPGLTTLIQGSTSLSACVSPPSPPSEPMDIMPILIGLAAVGGLAFFGFLIFLCACCKKSRIDAAWDDPRYGRLVIVNMVRKRIGFDVGDVQEAKSILFVQIIARIAVSVARVRYPTLVHAHEHRVKSGTTGGSSSVTDSIAIPISSPLPSITTSISSGSLNAGINTSRNSKQRSKKYFELGSLEADLLDNSSSSSSSSFNHGRVVAFSEPDVKIMMSMVSDMDDKMIAEIATAVCRGIETTCHFSASPTLLHIRVKRTRWLGCLSCCLCCSAFIMYEFATHDFEHQIDEVINAAINSRK